MNKNSIGAFIFLVTLFGVMVLAGVQCHQNLAKQETTQILTEDAVVTETCFLPAQHGSGSTTTITMNGDIGFGSTSINIPAQYAVVFQCQHGKFVIKDEDIWKKLASGDKVRVEYKEVYLVYKDGRREFLDFDFVDATKQ